MSTINIIAAIFGALGPAWIAWMLYRRGERLAARAQYLEEAVKRRQRAEEVKASIAAEEAAAVAEVKAKHTEAVAAVREEEQKIESTRKASGLAKAASEHVKRIRNTAKLIIVAFGLHAADARAVPEPCAEGVTLMAGDRIDCDAECLPADELEFLLKRSTRLPEIEADLERERGEHKAALRAASKRYDQCLSDYLDLEKSCEKATVTTADTISPSTYVLVAVGIFLVGVAAGAAGYHALRANSN